MSGMANSAVKTVADASGFTLGKDDGNNDQNCSPMLALERGVRQADQHRYDLLHCCPVGVLTFWESGVHLHQVLIKT